MSKNESRAETAKTPTTERVEGGVPARDAQAPTEIGGRESGLDPTRYGDWEKNGRCIDF